MTFTWRVVLLSALLVSLSAAYQQKPHAHHASQSQGGPAWTELRSSMERMHMAMASVSSSSNGDVDFVQLMLPHHQAALEMAKTELLHGKDPQIRRLAQEIITDQQTEIQVMEIWMKQHGTSAPHTGPTSHQ